MKVKAVIPRALAKQDVDDAIYHYLSEGAKQAALGFIDALSYKPSPLRRFHPLRLRTRPAGPALLAAGTLPVPGVLRRARRSH